jgi:hypothetical protein
MVSVVSMLCLFAGLAVVAGPAVAQSPNLHGNVTLTPVSLFFSVKPGGSTNAVATLSNQSGLPINVSKIEIDSTCPGLQNCGVQFHVASHGCGGSLQNGMSCAINIEFAPLSEVETVRGTLKVTFDGVSAAQTLKVGLTGEVRK